MLYEVITHLEVKGIADGDVAENMRGVDPIAGGILSREEIERGENDEGYRLKNTVVVGGHHHIVKSLFGLP